MPMYWQLKSWKSQERERVIDHLSTLRKSIAGAIPRKTASETLLLATWNIRDFDSNKFGHGPRLKESFHYIAEIISAFDLVAIQEVNEDMRPFEKVMDLLGPSWKYIATDITEGSSGNGERMVFVFDTNKVQFKHIAGEIVLPNTHLIQGSHQAARTPFLVRFQSGWFKFNLCTVHNYFGDASGDGYQRRVAEIDAIAKFIKKRADKDGQNYILLGDMNVVAPGDDTMKALKKHKFILPSELTLENDQIMWASNMKGDKHYDQIAFLVRKDELELAAGDKHAGVYNFYKAVFKDTDASEYATIGKGVGSWPASSAAKKKYFTNEWRSWQMSDHLPLFVELKIDFTDKYLQRIRSHEQPLNPPSPDAVDD